MGCLVRGQLARTLHARVLRPLDSRTLNVYKTNGSEVQASGLHITFLAVFFAVSPS